LFQKTPYADGEGEFVVVVLHHWVSEYLQYIQITHWLRGQVGVVGQTQKGTMEIVHVTLALEVEDVEEVEELKCEHGSCLLPSCGQPSLLKQLSQMTVACHMCTTAAVHNLHLVHAVRMINREVAGVKYW
jgi:hypothetical protein